MKYRLIGRPRSSAETPGFEYNGVHFDDRHVNVHVVGQGIIAGASMVLIDFHHVPTAALCDGPQALSLPELPKLLRYGQIVRSAFESATSPA